MISEIDTTCKAQSLLQQGMGVVIGLLPQCFRNKRAARMPRGKVECRVGKEDRYWSEPGQC